MRTIKAPIFLSLVVTVSLFLGCGKSEQGNSQSLSQLSSEGPRLPKNDASAGSSLPSVQEIASVIVEGVGKISSVDDSGKKGQVIVFEEYHTSKTGQLQIATMLLRLHEQFGMRIIGLEGALKSNRPLDASWFHNLVPPDKARSKEDIALRLLTEGEINSAEFMAMVDDGIQVHGLEVPEEYNIELAADGNPTGAYLIGIAEKNLSQSDIIRINNLLKNGDNDSAFEIIRNSDPWVKNEFEWLANEGIFSLRDMVSRLKQVRSKARAKGVVVDQKIEDSFDNMLNFYEVADQRSDTMTRSIASLVKDHGEQPLSMIIGAAHSKEVREALENAGIAHAVLRPRDFNPELGSLSVDDFTRKSEGGLARIEEGTLGRLLNGLRKPKPILETTTAKSLGSAYYVVEIVSEAKRRGLVVPTDIKEELRDLPELEIDWDSFSNDGFDVTFRMWTRDINGKRIEVWTRAGTADSAEEAKTLEEKLLQRISDSGGNGKEPPKPPTNSTPAPESGPGNGRRGNIVISRIGRSSLAVFAESKQKVTEVGRISG